MLVDDVVGVHHEPRPDGARQMPEVGIVIPAHASALGKAILAFDDELAEELLASPAARRSMTGETVTDQKALRAQLADVRATGIAYEAEEAVLGECGVAATLSDRLGGPVGALGLVVPSGEWPLEQATVDSLRTAARSVSRELGATRWPPEGNAPSASAMGTRRKQPRPA
jgi:DNA-binding IclR family transcriptional regulator